MKRYAANILWCSPGQIIKNGVLEIDEYTGKITAIFSLDEIGDEISNTLFFNGILLPFSPHLENSRINIYNLLQQQFKEKKGTGFQYGKKAGIWLLEGKDILIEQKTGNNWKITQLFPSAIPCKQIDE
jgi:hypothetical protein